MSSVVLRCPNCGTTQAAPGECEACHEAQVRYFCTNHDPGQWLTSPKCRQCGSQFGVAEPLRRVAPPPPRPPVQPPLPKVAPRPPAPFPVPKRRFNPWGTMSAPPGRAESEVTAGRLRDMLAGLSRRRRMPDASPYDMEPARIPAARGGCLGRALLLVILFLGLLLLLSVSAGGPFLQILMSLLLSS